MDINHQGESSKQIIDSIEHGRISQQVRVMLGATEKTLTFGFEYTWSYADKGGELIAAELNGDGLGRCREDFGEAIVTTLMEQGFDRDEANEVATAYEGWLDGHATTMCLDIFADEREYQQAHESV